MYQTIHWKYYIIPSDNWEQQRIALLLCNLFIISYQAITGNNNGHYRVQVGAYIISYQAIAGNNNSCGHMAESTMIISYQAITGNNNR